jgi:hypothetical protein
VYGFLARWSDDLTAITLTDRLREQIRTHAGRRATPTQQKPVEPVQKQAL